MPQSTGAIRHSRSSRNRAMCLVMDRAERFAEVERRPRSVRPRPEIPLRRLAAGMRQLVMHSRRAPPQAASPRRELQPGAKQLMQARLVWGGEKQAQLVRGVKPPPQERAI